MVEIANFDLLKNSHINITKLTWTKPQNCHMMQLYFGIKHAKEEIHRLDVETHHLVMFMIDDHVDNVHAINSCKDALASELCRQQKYHAAIHGCIAEQLASIPKLSDMFKKETLLPDWATQVLGICRTDDVPTAPDDVDTHRQTDDDDELYGEELAAFAEKIVISKQ
ncbi:hypothetical protein VNI00_017335 [Paramarasmius palmivorus]|uniref:Uncharacterized protein n=1 Tax=Paramarasmius palmivorus TaxID=297713 RepID=A0AAW0B5I2_9AGAR